MTEEIYVGIDADTLIDRHAISRLLPHFEDPRIAAVAGNAKVGNRMNLWTRWQALEYITSQNFERRALNVFGAVTVVPGALGAWRTERVREAGCYHTDTVAEDADLTMNLLERGYKVVYEDLALAYTEAPTTANGLMRQRFRWSFGILQAVWKRRKLFGRSGTLGKIALPNILVFQILLPLVSPFIDLMFVFGTVTYFIDRHFHPETTDPKSFEKLVAFFLAFLVIDFVASAIAFALERMEGANKRGRLAAGGHMAATLRLSAAFLGGAVPHIEPGDRRLALRLGQAGAQSQRKRAVNGAAANPRREDCVRDAHADQKNRRTRRRVRQGFRSPEKHSLGLEIWFRDPSFA